MAERQAALIAQWMNVGFIHGVMNTDNMTISGETIDYGPCAFMEAYDPAAVFSSIDRQGRYAYGNQPRIARWNLARLAETLLPLLSDDEEQATARWRREVHRCVPGAVPQRSCCAASAPSSGCVEPSRHDDAADAALADDWLALLHAERVDFTLAWRRLADAAAGDEAPLRALFADARRARRLARALARPLRAATSAAATPRAMRQLAGLERADAHAPRQSRGSSRATIASRKRSPPRPTTTISGRSIACSTRLQRPYDETPELAPTTPSRRRPRSPPCYRTFCGT